MEKLTLLMEKVLKNHVAAWIVGAIAILGPLYFLFTTVHTVWFGTAAQLVGYKADSNTWLMLTFVDAVGFLTTLPARKSGRVIQIVMALWTVEMFMVFIGTIVR